MFLECLLEFASSDVTFTYMAQRNHKYVNTHAFIEMSSSHREGGDDISEEDSVKHLHVAEQGGLHTNLSL